MRYGSICSGIEAATVAWHGLGWEPAFFSEIDNFPRAVLQHHYPNVPLHGDFTTINGDEYGHIDLLVGGTPCQDFSIAGLRAGFAGERGNLTLEFARLVDRMRPQWVVWENVPGVLSIDGGRAFGAFLGALAEIGYGFAYRILDAQYCGVPQRRRRVFVVGYLGDWRRAAAVLFERESLLGHPAPRREAGEGVAPTISARPSGGGGLGTDFDCDGGLIPSVSHCLNAGGMGRLDYEKETLIAHTLRAEGFDASEDGTGRGTPLVPVPIDLRQASRGEKLTNKRAHGSGGAPGHGIGNAGDPAFTVSERGQAIAQPIMAGGPVGGNQGGDFIVAPIHFQGRGSNIDVRQDVAATLGSNADRASGGAPCIAFDTTQITSKANYSNPKPGDPCHPLAAGAHPPAIAFEWQRGATQNLDMHEDFSPALIKSQTPAVAFDLRGREGGAQFEGPHDTANIRAASGGSSRSYVAATAVRRLTPMECERLQGFPDDYTLVPYRGKPASDGPRYKALGNSMAVPCMRWIGERIELIEALTKRIG
jgi:DNA (cytosine-5)-methyltransferase 1